MTKLNRTLMINLGIYGSALAAACCVAACSADSPSTQPGPLVTAPMQPPAVTPTAPGQPPGIVAVTPTTMPVASQPQTMPTQPVATTPNPNVTAPAPTQQGPGLPMPPTGVTPTAPVTPAPVQPAPAEPAPAEPEPEPTPAGGEGNVLIPNNNLWVAASTNGVGVEGSWYGYQDDVTTGCCEDLLTVTDGEVCMEGTTAAGEEENYDIYGAGMGFNFADSAAWDGSGYSGLSFEATVESDADVQVKIKMDSTDVISGGDHFAILTSGTKSLDWSDFEQPSWVESADATELDPSDIEAIQFQVLPGDGAENPFKVCIKNLTVED